MADEDNPSIYDVFGEPPEIDPERFGPVPKVPEERVASAGSALPHWSAPPTGQIPPVRGDLTGEEPRVWEDLSGPRWRGEKSGWADDDLEVVFGDEGSVVRHDDILNFDDPRLNSPAPPRPDLDLDDPFGDAVATVGPAGSEQPPSPPGGRRSVVNPGTGEVPTTSGAAADTSARSAKTSRRRSRQSETDTAMAAQTGVGDNPPSEGLGRNLPQAIGVGLGLAGLALVAILIHPLVGTALIAAVAAIAAVEFYGAVTHGGHHPAAMLGVVGAAVLPLAAYWRGEQAYAVVMAVTIIFAALWYIVGADTLSPLVNMSITVLGIFWIGGLAAFGAMLLRLEDGQQLLLGAILVTALADTSAFFGGRTFKHALFGVRSFSAWSTGKTWEGTLFGVVGAVVGALALDAVFSVATEWWHPAVFGLAVGVIAVIGDLFESMLKRDLRLKDMGSILPGHGGILDRVDALLFVLPAAYFVARMLDYV